MSAGAVTEAFREWTGAEPEGVWRAPGRVNLIGEHLDYNGGHVLPFAIDRAAWLAARRIPDPVLRARSAQYERPVEVPLDALAKATGWAAYPAGVLWALGEAGVAITGMEALVDSEVPQGGGLSSSAALECAMALAVADLAGVETDRSEVRRSLALAAQQAEATVAGAPVGNMDQMASLLSREGHALYLDTRRLGFRHLPLPTAEAGYRLLAVDTGHPHTHTTNAYAERRRACEQAAAALGLDYLTDARPEDLENLPPDLARRARHVVSEEARTRAAADALNQKRFELVGPLMTASHRSLQHDFENSTTALDCVVDAAVDAGAAGARLTGGGWGGAAVVLVPNPALDDVRRAVTGLGGVLDLTPAGPATRVA